MSTPAPTGTFNIVLANSPRLTVTSPDQPNQRVVCVPANNASPQPQQWTVTILGGNFVKIVNPATNLAIVAPQQTPRGPVISGPGGPQSSAWQFNSTGVQNEYNIITASSQGRLALTAGSSTGPSPLIINPISPDPLQRWTLVPVSTGGSA